MKTYGVKAVFDTVQGEGARAGMRAVFLRLTGCNAWNGHVEDRKIGKGACARWCDTDFVGGEKLDAMQIVDRLEACWPSRSTPGVRRQVVVTGGEPALQLDNPLVAALHGHGWAIAVETNGSVDNPALRNVDWITVSPKIGLELKIQHGLDRGVDELKIVLPGSDAAGWTDEELLTLERRLRARHLFVNPMDPINPKFVQISHLHGMSSEGTNEAEYRANVKRCLDFVQLHPQWRVGVQLHKYLGVE